MEPTTTTEHKTNVLRRRAADGTVYARIAKRQLIEKDYAGSLGSLYHWCASENPELLTPETPVHVCDVWATTDDQSEPESRAIEPTPPTTDELIRRLLLFTEEQLSGEPAPLLLRTAVFGILQQAKALEQIVTLLEDWRHSMKTPRGIRVRIERPPADPTT